MSMKWKQGDWEIHLNATGALAGDGWCLRHMGCSTPIDTRLSDPGQCSCSKGVCYNCKIEVPDEIRGFFALVKWKR